MERTSNEIAMENFLLVLARKRLRKQNVELRLSKDGERQFLKPWRTNAERFGTLINISRDGKSLIVRLHGRITPSSYHPSFWEPV